MAHTMESGHTAKRRKGAAAKAHPGETTKNKATPPPTRRRRTFQFQHRLSRLANVGLLIAYLDFITVLQVVIREFMTFIPVDIHFH